MEFVRIGLVAAGVYIVYKMFTTKLGEPDEVEPPPNNLYYGDDNQTFIQEQHTVNRHQPIAATPVAPGLSHSSINNAIFETNPRELTDLNLNLPQTVFVNRLH